MEHKQLTWPQRGALWLRLGIRLALAALALADFLAIDSSLADSALQGYQGTDRRFQHKGTIGGVTVSSTYIRRLLELGQVERAHRFLGHPHTLTGTVGHGRGLGSSRLFPTANLPVPPHVLVPSYGVYVTRVYFTDGTSCPAVTNVGTRPTVNSGSDVTVEACLLDFQGDLYGQTLRLEFYKHLRDEIRFDSLDAQIAADAETTRRYFQER